MTKNDSNFIMVHSIREQYKWLLEIPSLSAFFCEKISFFRIDGFDCNWLFSEVNYVLPIAQQDLSQKIIETVLIVGITANFWMNENG